MKCRSCGFEKFVLDQSFDGFGTYICGSCGEAFGDAKEMDAPMPMKDVTPKLPAKKPFSPEQLLSQWLREGNLEGLVLVGMIKGGGWKYGTSGSSFEFLSGAEGVVQKLKLASLVMDSKK